MVLESITRPYRVPVGMVLLALLVPCYILVPAWWPPPIRYAPELPIDRALPLLPSWALVYGALYLFLILLPFVMVRQNEHLRRMVHAYLMIWLTSYVVFFWIYPTSGLRPASVAGGGFGAWGLRILYAADPPVNCFPSLHVAHSFVSAFACYGVHRRIGLIAGGCAILVALSTLFTKQHYVADVGAGIVLAMAACAVFLRGFRSEAVPAFDRRAAPALAVCVGAVVALALVMVWVAYFWTARVSAA